MDRSGIVDRSGWIRRRRGKIVLPRGKIAIRNVRGGGEEPRNVHLASLAEENSVGVDDPDLAVRRKAAVDLRDTAAEHAVERNRSRARLRKDDARARWKREALPVDDGCVGCLL